jgi:hypothetical protein
VEERREREKEREREREKERERERDDFMSKKIKYSTTWMWD